MTVFNVGDRCRSYSFGYTRDGTICNIKWPALLIENENGREWFDYRQCRKLVKNERAEYWLGKPLGYIGRMCAFHLKDEGSFVNGPDSFPRGKVVWIKVREVKKP